MAYTVLAQIGDKKVTLKPGQTLGPYLVHVSPSKPSPGIVVGNNTGREVRRADVPSCGEGDSDYLKPDSKVTFNVVNSPGSCTPPGSAPIDSPIMNVVRH